MWKGEELENQIQNDLMEFFNRKYEKIKFIFLFDTGEMFFVLNDYLYKLCFKAEIVSYYGEESFAGLVDFFHRSYEMTGWEMQEKPKPFFLDK